MAGFSADINTNVQAPEVTPIPQATGDDVSDTLQVASFGLNLYNQYKDQAEQERKIERQRNLLGDSQKITEQIFEAKSQKNLSIVEEQRLINRLTGSYSNPVEKQFVIENIAKNLTSGLLKEARAEQLSEEQQLDSFIGSIPIGFQETILKGQNLGQMSVEDKRNAADEWRKIAAEQQRKQIAMDGLANNPNINAFNNAIDASISSSFGLLQAELSSLMQQVNQRGSDPDLVALLGQAKTNTITFLNSVESELDAAYKSTIKTVSDKKQLDLIKSKYETTKASYANYRKQLDDMNEEQFKSVASIAQLMKDKSDTSLQRSFPKLLQLKEMFGTGFNAVTSMVLAKNPSLVDLTGDAILEGVEGVLGTPAGAAALAKTLDLDAMTKVISEGSLLDYASKDRDAASTLWWNAASSLIEDPNSIDQMTPDQINNLGLSIIGVLERADELGDADSMANANALLASTAMDRFIDKLPEDQRVVVSNYVARSSAEFISRDFKNTLEDIDYDIASGKVTIGTTKTLERFPDERSRERVLATLKQREANLNARLEKTAQTLKKYHPAVDTTQQAKEYLLGAVRPDLVKGGVLEEDRKQAIEQNVKLQVIQDRAALRQRVQDIEERTATLASPARQAVDQATEERQNPVELSQVNQLDDEEYATWLESAPESQEKLSKLSDKGREAFFKLSREDQMEVLMMTPRQIQLAVSGMSPDAVS